MQTLLVSYTLRRPGQDYDAIADLLNWCSVRIAHADAGLWYIQTSYSEAVLERLISAVMDPNDSFTIWGPNVRPYNRTVDWQKGAQASAEGAIAARNYLRKLLARSLRA